MIQFEIIYSLLPSRKIPVGIHQGADINLYGIFGKEFSQDGITAYYCIIILVPTLIILAIVIPSTPFGVALVSGLSMTSRSC